MWGVSRRLSLEFAVPAFGRSVERALKESLSLAEGRSRTKRSVNAVYRFLEIEDPLMCLYLSPETHGLTHEPALPGEAILFHHAVETGESIASVGDIHWNHRSACSGFKRGSSVCGQRSGWNHFT